MPTNERIIFSRKFCIELRKLGFHFIRVEPNLKHLEFDCWVFENTPELQAALTKITAEHKATKPLK